MGTLGSGHWGDREEHIAFAVGRVVMRYSFKPGSGPSRPALIRSLDAWLAETRQLEPIVAPLPNGYRAYWFEADPRDSGESTLAVINSLNADDQGFAGLSYEAYPDDLMAYHGAVPTDDLYDQQWGLCAVGVPEAWRCTQGSQDVWLGIIDSGIPLAQADNPPGWEYLHVDLDEGRHRFGLANAEDLVQIEAGYSVPFARYSSYSGDLGGLPIDDEGHGTHVVGIMSADANNDDQLGGGIAGVNWHSPVYVLKGEPLEDAFGNQVGSGALAVSSALAEVTAWLGAHPELRMVINISMGGSDASEVVRAAVLEAIDVGAIVVASTGNSFEGEQPQCGGNVCAPARYVGDPKLRRGLVSVGAVVRAHDLSLVVPAWSNGGAGEVTVVAPGGGVLSTTFVMESGVTDWGTMEGTSQAAPLVSGIVSLLWSAHPEMPAKEVIRALIKTADPLVPDAPRPDPRWGWGVVNAHRLVCPDS